MKFTTVWAATLSQNVTLRIVLICLSAVTVVFGVIAAKTANKPAIVVERSCQSKVLTEVNSKHTQGEIQSFVFESLSQRFDSSNQASSQLSAKESGFKSQEQRDLQSRNMRQRILINSVKITDKQIEVDSDRIISVGDVRSAFSFPLRLVVEATRRSENNPYGLVLAAVSPLKKEDKTDNK